MSTMDFSNDFYRKAFRLFSVLTNEDWASGLLSVLYDFWECPVILSDYTHKVLSSHLGKSRASASLVTLLDKGEFPDEWINNHFYKALDELTESISVGRFNIEGDPTVSAAIFMNGTCYGYLSFKDNGILDIDSIKKTEDSELIHTACSIAAVRLSNQKEQGASSRSNTLLLRDIISSAVENESDLQKRLHYISWSAQKYNIVVGFNFLKEEVFPSEAYLLRKFANLSDHITVIGFDKWFYLLLTGSSEQQLDLVCDRLCKYAIKNKKCAGLSDIFANLLDLPKHYRQAQKALSTGIDNSTGITHYNDIRLSELLSEMEQTADIDEYFNRAVLRLLEYDDANNTSLAKTLYYYLNNAKSVTGTSRALYMHKNTITNQIEKIKTITGSDLSDQEELLHMILTFKLLGTKDIN